MDNLGKNWQLINILFCGYRRRLEIHYWRLPDPLKMNAETYTRQPQRVNMKRNKIRISTTRTTTIYFAPPSKITLHDFF